jgi:hypothetical protein
MAFIACGSNGGVGDDDAQTGDDSGNEPDVTNTNDSGNPQKDSGVQDSTVETGPTNDATLDVNFGDAIWMADSQGGKDSAIDTGSGCSPDEILCNGNVAEICKNGSLSTQTCANNQVCADGYGCVTCVPGSGTCNGSQASLCNSQGTGYIVSNCDSQLGLSCQAGVCVGDCANVGESYIGCEYYAVTMLNDQLDQSTFAFAVSVANTTNKTATVNISGPNTVTGNPFTISANSIASIVLPWETSISKTTGTLKQTGGAYHIKSTEPVTVYQFNARDYQVNVTCASDLTSPPCHSFTNDASLLIPVNALTGNYYVVSFPDWNASADGYASQHLPGLITIVGTQASTSVQFTPAVSVAAGAGITATGTSTVTLNAGDVLQINSTANATSTAYGTEPSGSVIKASAPVEVFGGADCTNVPVAVQACDHVEEIVFPTETLANTYVVVPPNMTGITTTKKPSHFVRMVGTVASTTLSYTPAVTGAPATLNAGQVALFETSTPFQVTASQPIAIGMYMESSQNYGGGTLNGDPAMSVAVGTSQFRDNYAFTAPNNYYINWATIVAPTGNSVTVDTTTISSGSFTAIGTSGYGYYHYKICDNGGSPTCSSVSSNHTASSSGAFGIQVYGYGSYTSYWYPGGLNLTR